MTGETIFAQATPAGRSGIAVIRVSGTEAFSAATALCGAGPADRRAHLHHIRDPRNEQVLDHGLVLRFAGPASFTGEDVAEFHIHGGPAVCRSVLAALAAQPGLRPAEAGEFTRRALMNGRLDLVQVEGLGDLLAAETAEQQRAALSLMDGALSRVAAEWRADLVTARALMEASIDFSDEELPDTLPVDSACVLEKVKRSMDRELAGSQVAERLREGFEVALVGPPNVGKSTLLNAIARREAAIVSAMPGTTRDVLEVQLELDGLPITLLDMAGIRETQDAIESLGVARARARAVAADIRVFLVDGVEPLESLGVIVAPGDLVLRAKQDLAPAAPSLGVSGLTGEGIPELLAAVATVLRERSARAGTLNRERQRVAVAQARAHVAAALVHTGREPEIVAEEIRLAIRALDSLIGRVDVEAVLDLIFQSFCIGK